MNPKIKACADTLTNIIEAIPKVVTYEQPASIKHGNNWQISAIDRMDLIHRATKILELIQDHHSEISAGDIDVFELINSKLSFLKVHCVPQLAQNPTQAIPAYVLTLNSVSRDIKKLLPPVDFEAISTKVSSQKKRIRYIDTRLAAFEADTDSLDEKISTINEAHDTALSLPTDLEELKTARRQLQEHIDEAEKHTARLDVIMQNSENRTSDLNQISANAKLILDECKTVLASATSVGLASAFTERSKSLDKSIYWWVGGLVIALISGAFFGSTQVHSFANLLASPSVSSTVILINLILTVVSVGAPVWFAWLATKQIGQRFRLSEDYAFKASISTAYEGYRREAERIDQALEEKEEFARLNMEAKLLQSALSRLDELPLRLVETQTHGSPWAELLSSELLRDAIKTVPGFAGKLTQFAEQQLGLIKKQTNTRKERIILKETVGEE